MSESRSNSNPFVLPGLGQNGDMAGNPLLASMEMMRQAWAGVAGPAGLAQSLPMAPPMSLEDLERRITELRSVESWLRVNLSMLGSAIQGLEVQRATIATLRSFVGGAAAGGDPSPLEIALGLKPAPASTATKPPPAAAAESAPSSESDSAAAPDEPAPTAEQVSHAAQTASQAWWNLLQQQFNQLAAATAATMPEPAAAAGATSPEPSRPAPRKRAPRKPAAKRGTSRKS